MTEHQREEIQRLRLDGKSYTQISELLGLSRNTVKSVCQRNDFHSLEGADAIADLYHCCNCGVPILQTIGRKHRRFCCAACRRTWWGMHRDTGKKKTTDKIVCEYCGRSFEDYAKNHRKYCCHACYIANRFGKGRLHDE